MSPDPFENAETMLGIMHERGATPGYRNGAEAGLRELQEGREALAECSRLREALREIAASESDALGMRAIASAALSGGAR